MRWKANPKVVIFNNNTLNKVNVATGATNCPGDSYRGDVFPACLGTTFEKIYTVYST